MARPTLPQGANAPGKGAMAAMPWSRGLAVVASMWLVSCGSGAQSIEPTALVSPIGSPTNSASPSVQVATASPPDSPSPSVRAAPANAPPGWAYVSWADPALELALPLDWVSADPRAEITPEPGASFDPAQQNVVDWANDMAASGATRFVGYGQITAGSRAIDGGTISVFVEGGDASLDAFADRSIQLDKRLSGESISIDREAVALPFADAVRVAFAAKIGGWPKFNEVDYLFRLKDGRSLTVAVVGNDAAADPSLVETFASQLIATLRPVPDAAGTSVELPDGRSRYTATDGSFSIEFPRPPVETTDTDAAGNTSHGLTVDSVYTLFKVEYFDAPPGAFEDEPVETLLDRIVAGITPTTATVTNVHDVSIDGHPGREITAETPDVLVGRVYVVGDRLYLLQTLTYPEFYADETADVRVFLESFQLARR